MFKIFTIDLVHPGHSPTSAQNPQKVAELESAVNELIARNPGAQVQWLQSGSKYGTSVTAIISLGRVGG